MTDRPDWRPDDPAGGERVYVADSKPTYGVGSLLALLGALAIALSVFLVWGKEDYFDDDLAGSSTTIQLLWDTIPTAFDEQPTLLFVLLPAAILVLLGTFIPRVRVLAIIGGALALLTAVLFFINMTRVISDFDLDGGAFDAIGIGVWLAAIGGLVALVGALIIPRRAVVR